MKQTNYHLFDLMDFDPALEKDEVLWKAYAPTTIKEQDGDIVVTIPYQQQLHQEDMAPDTSVPQQCYDLIIRAYEPNIVRVFTTMTGDDMTEEDEMLKMAPEVKRVPLRYVNGDIFATDGKKVAAIDLSTPALDYWSDLLPAPQPAPRITFYPDGNETKGIALSDDHFSPPRYDALPLGFVSRGSASTYGTERATISFKCAPDECFTGTGERFRKMDLSGQTFQLKNQDGQGVNNRRCYKNIPFYLSSRMYGVFYHTSSYCKLSFADHSTRSVQFLSEEPVIDAFIIGGNMPEQILHGYRCLTGFPPMLPLWSFGIWMSRMTYFSAEEVNAICNRLRSEKYPCDVIHLDTGWFKTDWLCEWKFNEERFPNPLQFIHDLKDKGFRVSLWQLPYIAEDAEQIDEARAHHYIAEPQRKDLQQAEEGRSNFSSLDYAGTIDFTSPEATVWYKGLLKRLLDMGVACIKTDFGENIHMDAKYFGMTPEKLNNLYALLYQKAAFEITREICSKPSHYAKAFDTSENAGIVWARSAWAGCQRYPLHWGGDSAHSWDGMAASLKGGLHFGLSGFSFWSHDVPGFHSLPDFMNSPLQEDIYVRWTQFGVFSSHIRYHGSHKREPWCYPSIAPIIRRWWNLRYHLMPYIYEEAKKTTRTGNPMIRALLMEHPDDPTVWHVDDEYYFGSKFLCCPVMNSQNCRNIYLPAGKWVNFFTGEHFDAGEGGWIMHYEVPLDLMPVFVRPSTEIPIYFDEVECTDQINLDKAGVLVVDEEFGGIEF